MLESAVARRYAFAFFEIAQEQKALDKFEEELVTAQKTFQSVEKLDKFLANQLVPSTEKKKAVNTLFKGKLSELTVNFLNLVIDKRREEYFNAIIKEFQNYANKARNITDALVISAKELAKEDVDKIKQKLSAMTGKNVNLTTTIDPEIKGGLIVQMGDKIIDGSLARRFEIMKQRLLQ